MMMQVERREDALRYILLCLFREMFGGVGAKASL